MTPPPLSDGLTTCQSHDLEDERLNLTVQLGDVRSALAAVNAEMRQIRTFKPTGGRTMLTEAEQRRAVLVTKQADLEVDLAAVKQDIRDRHQPLGIDDPRLEVLRLLRTMADEYELVPLRIAKELRELVIDDVNDDVSADLRTWANP
jgi:hypothetical protein